MNTRQVTVSDESLKLMQELAKDCPMPTDGEFRKLLAIQGTILNEVGIALLASAGDGSHKHMRNCLNLAFKALEGSRSALKAAASLSSEETPFELQRRAADID